MHYYRQLYYIITTYSLSTDKTYFYKIFQKKTIYSNNKKKTHKVSLRF